jgi:adenine-specific DNA methylase
MSIEFQFDVSLIASMALKEKQIQQNYRPIIAVHKWFARRPGTLFRGLILSEFADRPLAESFFEANDFPGRLVVDPFMGGGTPLLEANRVGCDVQGFDINPMAAWIVREEIEHLDLDGYRQAARSLINALTEETGSAYKTNCPLFGDHNVPVKYFLWVKTTDCEQCGHEIDLFPGYLLADNTRHPKHVLVCSHCGELNEVVDRKELGKCHCCGTALREVGPARRNRCDCPGCGHVNTYPRPNGGPPRHRMFAIEYHNPRRRGEHRGRFFKKPDNQDLAQYDAVVTQWRSLVPRFVPDQIILSGDETDRLHRWGYRSYKEMFNERQLFGLELSCRRIAAVNDGRIRRALATNLSDLLRYQNLLCRYDTMALKSLDIFSIHGFPVGLVQCESNLLGISNGNGSNVGSGGWSNIVEKYSKAKEYCYKPFEVRHQNGKKKFIPIKGEWIGERSNGARPRRVSIECTSATTLALQPESLDAVFTDPPYFGNVQYGELMDFCYVWLRRLIGAEAEGFDRESSRSLHELTGNLSQARGLNHFADGLSAIYRSMACSLKRGAPLAFTFHHNRIEVYHAVGVAILDSGLTCSTTLPCPAEMGGSIHIHGTQSSIVDTVFVCRLTGRTRRSLLFENEEQLRKIVENDVTHLRIGGVKPTLGDIRCVTFGHLTRMAAWRLRSDWRLDVPTEERLHRFANEVTSLVDLNSFLRDIGANLPQHRTEFLEEDRVFTMDIDDAVPF